MDAPYIGSPPTPFAHSGPRNITTILRPLYARMVRLHLSRSAGAFIAPAMAEPRPAAEITDRRGVLDAVALVARDEPDTVAQSRALLADPHAALDEPELERQLAWLVALADLHHRRAATAGFGGTAA